MNREEKTKKFLRILTFGGMLVLAALSALSCAACASEAEKPYAEGRILVKLARTGKSENAALSLAAGGFSEERAAGMTVAKSWHFSPSDAEARTGGAARTLAADADEGATIALLVSETMTTEQMLAAAAQDEAIEYAEPDYKIYPTSVPDDPGFSEQWAYNGEENRPTGGSAHLEITGAWEQAASQQTNEVVVAVVDTGVDYGHPDLQNNMWNGENDGYDNHGWNATEAKDSEAYKDPMDSDGHGTHVAGIIAAVPGNGQGIAGAARSVKILAAKVLGGGEGFSSFVIDTYSNLLALKKAGVNIVATNNSWTAPILSKSAGEAMERLGAAGVVNVIAAANDHADNDVTPGFPYNLASDYSVVVAASTPWDEIAEFSNYGRRSVHIAAPGAWILSTYSRKVPNPERSMLENSFVKAFAEEQDKLFYYGDFATADGLTPGPGQSVSTDNGYLEWTVTAGSAGTYRLKIDAAIDLKSVNAESGSEFKDELHLCVTSMSDKSFSLSLCAPDEEGGVNRDSRVVVGGNFNHDGNFWKGQITKISDPYWYAPEFESFPRYGEAELVWASDSAYLELSINLDAGESRTVKVKEIAITQGAPYNPDAPYRYMDGTSMASPAAAGCLALIASLNPDMSAAELRARIIGGAVKIPSMKDKLLTGGRLSVNKALEDPSPVVNSLSASGGLLAVEGFFFGDSEGSLTLRAGGVVRELSVKEWTENKITAELPDIPSGWCEATVTRPDGDWGRRITELAAASVQMEPLASMPMAMSEAKFAVDEENGLIYVAGCRPQEAITGDFACYDIAADKWRTLADLPEEIYASEDESGNTIEGSLGVGFTLFEGRPTALRNYAGRYLLVASFDGAEWRTTEIKENNYLESFVSVLFAAPAKDGRSILMLDSIGALWRVTPDEGKIEKLTDVGRSHLGSAMITAKEGTIAIFGGAGEEAAAPIFTDGESTWRGEPCPWPENGEFSWTKAAFGWYGDFLFALEGTNNVSETIGNGAYYGIGEGRWTAAPTGRTAIRNYGASAVAGDYLYCGAITDYFNGVTDGFERLNLRGGAPEPTPEHGGGGGCSAGWGALALLAAIPMIPLKKKK